MTMLEPIPCSFVRLEVLPGQILDLLRPAPSDLAMEVVLLFHGVLIIVRQEFQSLPVACLSVEGPPPHQEAGLRTVCHGSCSYPLA